jgi:GAF domain-containing protein
MLSTQFRQPHRFSEHDKGLADISARQAADAINAYLLQRELRESEARWRKVLETDAIAAMFFEIPARCSTPMAPSFG